ncbi:shikimate dehydrogenase [Candidatus Roizmanbacteria bacterium RIFCSPHIGHO2_01_FULL_39_8]|uniref:Shikimate dehydrogenase (NADP(+)) n=1 Tax=Candidatus Roizmanbacteria bacterium RIFCSPHIGHO2_01_FULL_39_8 TaxID=1802033 RepID=A0A1F7GJG1_9BACT|nr:MAG: shikimate dehydrogenase [Candidatus Roizmanbacteria bacterium RIFCSPHIGHO2_01_FULL_39_8]
MRISAKTKMCIIIGDPVEHSLSPALHNSAYESLGIDDQFVYLGSRVKIENIKSVVEAMRVMNIRGLTCTIPHKIEVMKYLDWIDETAKKIGAVNSVVNDDGVLKGYNTDWLGVVTPLERITSLKNKKVAVLGAGGVARSIIFGVQKKGAQVTVLSRTLEKAKQLAGEFECEATSLSNKLTIQQANILINATPIGMHPYESKTPMDTSLITKNHIVFDAVYIPYETQLLKVARKRSAKIIHGVEMLLYQGTAQFELYTNYKAPEKVMRKVLYDKLIRK